jgi:hypothetical protein
VPHQLQEQACPLGQPQHSHQAWWQVCPGSLTVLAAAGPLRLVDVFVQASKLSACTSIVQGGVHVGCKL